ncbi:hydantoinase B/oxoprolinase family protein [Natronosalvus rutilus]|uniref:Hydantoinase B/oxoprolinase family protein n=1 Tax=Natronosalvus rutilus TaxID=2953753 RepID=A0A9E7N9Y3_9EURY|nr:hydantoinase B/oxoprolinase family protein [Natronosalvus rutilus]UTF54509.1 hydantoinase B/oxoprolinase family protein [Natronosalvus rutilus]
MTLDAVTLEVLRNRLEGIAEEMGHVLIHGAYSPNIKERRDCSTALFDAEGRMVAQAEHIPVHLGAMPEAVRAVRERDPEPGEAYVLNDPFTGGTHLPDVTIVAPIDVDGDIVGYGVTRAHHGDVGGMTPGSMPAGATEIYQEGLRLPPTRLVVDGEVDTNVLSLALANVRNPAERRADLRAQLAATDRARDRVRELVAERGRASLEAAFDGVIEYSRERIETELEAIPDGTYRGRDWLEGDGIDESKIPLEVAVTVDGATVDVDFAGTANQVAGNMNAPLAVARSAVYFVLRAVTDPDIPPNDGCYQPVTVRAPAGSVLNPNRPAAVVGGNVETSQRMTDVVLSAFAEAVPGRVPAQSQGTMNNLIIGSRDAEGFTYYETIGGGFGARPDRDGVDGVQVGMTNTLNTPIEALEAAYPMRVERYALRAGSGGDGRYRGGLGLERSITVEVDATVSLLTERRRLAPRGASGGADGATGENRIDGRVVPAKTTVDVEAGTTVTVETPGGGGYGDPVERDSSARERDALDGKSVAGKSAESGEPGKQRSR